MCSFVRTSFCLLFLHSSYSCCPCITWFGANLFIDMDLCFTPGFHQEQGVLLLNIPRTFCCVQLTFSLTHLCRVDFSSITLRTDLFPIKGYLVSFYNYHSSIEIPVFNTNSVDPDQMPRSAASDLDLHCLAMPL